jgi:hypothetical protein
VCYAKITPAALRCSDLGLATTGGGEAAGGMREFALSDFRRVIAGLALPAAQALWMTPS